MPGRASYNNLQQPQQPYNTDPQRMDSKMRQPSNATPAYSVQPQQGQFGQAARRTLSNGTSSTSSSHTNTGLQRAPTDASGPPRRSTSSRSTSSASPTSYVALMRKQKATVWCDRAQHEDPGILAAQRRAKMRAAEQVAGGQHRFSTSSNAAAQSVGIRSKIRHHGAPKASTYTGQPNMAGAGVPMRLSASEVDDKDSDEEQDSKYMNYHQRTGSRGSSFGSGRQGNYLSSGRGHSDDSTPQSGHSPVGSMGDLKEEETPMPHEGSMTASDYFQGENDGHVEAEQRFGGISGLPPPRMPAVEQERMTTEELRRRGSVDERTMTLSGPRLFVANPDLSD